MWRLRMRMYGIRGHATEERTSQSLNERPSHVSATVGLVDAYPLAASGAWTVQRGGTIAPATSTRISACVSIISGHRRLSKPRLVWSEIDREARKGKPMPSDHAPLVIDIDSPGYAFDAGWTSADQRIAGRRARRIRKNPGSPRSLIPIILAFFAFSARLRSVCMGR
jgi:hypothetical protein